MGTEIRLLRVKEVAAKCSIGVSTVWRLVKEGKFPKHVTIGAGSTVWHSKQIDDWINKQFEDYVATKQNDGTAS